MIDGSILAAGFISGANMLYNKRNEVDALNVFPVPDGDTGTNMSMTANALAKALDELKSDSVSKVCDTMSYATLRGARGNSGVILSQYFRGIAKYMKGKNTCSVQEFAESLKSGSDAAYAAVMNPTEGTILTVGKAAATAAVFAAKEGADLKATVEAAVEEAKKTLAKTPDMLPALKSAGVVDAGGQGWVYILTGLLASVSGNAVEREGGAEESKTETKAQATFDGENIKFGYCTEFIIEKSKPDVNVLSFRQSIEDKGDSMLVIDDDEIVKVHIHTNNPGYVLERAIKLGALINIKIDNMRYQHQNLLEADKPEDKKPVKKKKYGFVSVCAGEGLEELLKDLGVDVVIKGGQTMNPSTEDILEAANSVNAENVFIFPNNKNIIMAATQAAGICENKAVVIPSKSVPACVAGMLRFDENSDVDANVEEMEDAAATIKTAQVTYAVRDTVADGKTIHEGDIIGVGKSGIEAVGEDTTTVVSEIVANMYNDDEDEFITLYYGEDTAKDEAEALAESLEEKYPDAEVTLRHGGQPVYYYIVSVE
ncbi:MAG: DAK2 domain-containing protein [Eubacteriales bacterium]|nr:DAK2 domain-containing protein [Eubacteriales bacterium]